MSGVNYDQNMIQTRIDNHDEAVAILKKLLDDFNEAISDFNLNDEASGSISGTKAMNIFHDSLEEIINTLNGPEKENLQTVQRNTENIDSKSLEDC